MPGRPTTLNRGEVMKAVTKRWFTPCSDGYIASYLEKDGQCVVQSKFNMLRAAGKVDGQYAGDGNAGPTTWRAVIFPDVKGQYDEVGYFIRPDGDGVPISDILPGGYLPPPELMNAKWKFVEFYRKGKDHHRDGLVDCAHFVSDCLRHGNGRIQMQPSVPSLLVQLRGRSETRTLGLRVTAPQVERILATGVMEPGDVIIFTKGGDDHHSSIYTGNVGGVHRIACHTFANFNQFFSNQAWHLEATDNTFTLITFDLPLIAATGKPLRAEVRVGGVSEVYYLYSNGIARRSRGTSSSHQPPSMHPQDHGYWFNQAFDAFVFWTMTGQVVTIPQRVDFYSDFSSASSMYVNSDGVSGEMIPFHSDD
jgi:hypothetical protein